ncbi:MAG TPA: phospholipase D-like domain-containing protein, partial [Longimicrobiales bacterium]|nr:phospholipase D-like domain-containing protein [Longimicrobiales bacterium]
FSDHNFAWHDMMLRVESEELTQLLGSDFEASWAGRPAALDTMVGPLRVISLNGRGNGEAVRPVLDVVSSARESIDVVSAYLSHPFTDHLAQARRRGIRVRVLTPSRNNKSNLARHILETAHRSGFDVYRYAGGMSHMKAMLVDGEVLVAGSSNFDFMSYHILEELVVITRHSGMIEDFTRRVWLPDVADLTPVHVRSSLGTRLGDAVVRVGAALAGTLALT